MSAKIADERNKNESKKQGNQGTTPNPLGRNNLHLNPFQGSGDKQRKVWQLHLLRNCCTFFNTEPVRQPKPENLSAKEFVCRKFGKDCKTALEIIRLESNFNQYAINKNKDGSLDLGMWQLNEKYQKVARKDAFDPIISTHIAYNIYKAWGNNFNAWTTSKKLTK